ncbi:FtsX-like permease family protein [Pseudonocardia sp. H11422]|uniref:FtsX-like permease family protein n=1 Tax=Pseudonocardia sp. H11422 TaxID=2835866 RepID=UPI001BDD077B|nr:ABC transporter permease [Pseudonocardia sp. H11422]
MIPPAAAALLAETRRRPGRLLLTGLAVTVAIVFAAGTLLLADTLRAHLTAGSVQTPAAVATVVGGPVEPEVLKQVSAVDGAGTTLGVWNSFLTVRGPGAAGSWRVSSDPFAGELSRVPGALEGRLPVADGEAAIGASTAERTGLRPGARLTVAGDDGAAARAVTLTVTGIAEIGDSGLNTLVATPGTVAALGGRLMQIDVTAVPGTDATVLADRMRASLDGVSVRTGDEQRTAEADDASETVTAVLGGVSVFAGLALVAAAVVVASTFRIVLTQRRTQLALLRCVGARRRGLIGAVLAEAALSGLVAGVLGAGTAVLAGYGLLAVLRARGVANVPDLVVAWPGLAGCVLLAVVATVLAAVGPAVAASRIPPVAALGAAATTDAGAPRRARRFVFAGVLALAAAGLAILAVTGVLSAGSGLPIVVLAVSGMLGFAALVVVGPVLIGGLAATLGRAIAAVGRAPGRLAVANAGQVPRRTAATISVLTLGVGLTSALLVAIASVQLGAEEQIAADFPSEVVVVPSEPADLAALAERLSAAPELAVREGDGQLLVDPAPGADGTTARAAVDATIGAGPGVLVTYAADMRTELESTVATTRAVGLGLVGMTVIVAVVGVGVTLMLSITERTRETGLLRAVGLTRRGVRAMVAWEAVLAGSAAAVLGAVIGAGYGLLGVRALDVGFDPWSIPVPTLTGLVVGIVAVAVLAAVVPALRAGRVPPIRALQNT